MTIKDSKREKNYFESTDVEESVSLVAEFYQGLGMLKQYAYHVQLKASKKEMPHTKEPFRSLRLHAKNYAEKAKAAIMQFRSEAPSGLQAMISEEDANKLIGLVAEHSFG